MKKLLDVVDEEDLRTLIEEQELTYPEVAAKINEVFGVEFHRSTIGKHWRKIREKEPTEKENEVVNEKEYEKEKENLADYYEPELHRCNVKSDDPNVSSLNKIHKIQKDIYKSNSLKPKNRSIFSKFKNWLSRLVR